MYKTVQQLPKGVKENLPEHAQEIYKESFNTALEQYSDRDDTESIAHRVAWGAVKQKYEKTSRGWRRLDHD